jgi:cobyrinic acid a,c-diamide synthase
MTADFHSLCIAGTHSGVGKTTLTLGLMAALKHRGLAVQPFKCGPDYIDAGHHAKACGRTSRNLDSWMMGEEGVRESYARAVRNADAAVVEGVMGLFDGASANSPEGSTAHIAELLDLPVLLVIDARGMARSIAAMAQGYARFMPGLKFVGVIANNVAGERHARILRDALEAAGGPPLLGVLPREKHWVMPERHLGLISPTERGAGEEWFNDLSRGVEEHLDIERLLQSTLGRRPMDRPFQTDDRFDVRLGIARDAAFHFYYEDNLDLLRSLGAELIKFSPLSDAGLPEDLDGVYIGGGFPEMFAQALEANLSMRRSIHDFAHSGGSIFAECGGFMYLCRSLTDTVGKNWEMCGVFDAITEMHNRRVRLGYVQAATIASGLFGGAGTELRGHEFHWSSLVEKKDKWEPVFEVSGADGQNRRATGIRSGNLWASYIHVHFASNPGACRAWLRHLKSSDR